MRLAQPCRAPRTTAWVVVSVNGVPDTWRPLSADRFVTGYRIAGPAPVDRRRVPRAAAARAGGAGDLAARDHRPGARARFDAARRHRRPPPHADRAGVDVVRRRSGGGAVLLIPGEVVWIDVILPAGAEGWSDDVHRPMVWLGEHLAAAFAGAGVVGADVHDGAMISSETSRLVCFDGLGPGEVSSRRRETRRHQPAAHAIGGPAPGVLVHVLRPRDPPRPAAARHRRHRASSRRHGRWRGGKRRARAARRPPRRRPLTPSPDAAVSESPRPLRLAHRLPAAPSPPPSPPPPPRLPAPPRPLPPPPPRCPPAPGSADASPVSEPSVRAVVGSPRRKVGVNGKEVGRNG